MNKLDDLYLTLGVSSRASFKQIRLAYKKLARQLHPDHNPDDPLASQRFSKLTEAYRVLSDPQKRRAYDLYRKDETSAKGVADSGASMSAFFKKLFGADGPQPEDGRDLKTSLTVMLSDLVSGSRIHLEIPSSRACPQCKGMGKSDGDNDPPCPACKGSGRENFSNKLEVRIPAGLEDGTTLRISGEGEAGLRGGKNGDLLVHVTVKPHPLLRRQGRDLHCQVPIPLGVAILGGEVNVPGLEKSLTLKIPAGTFTGKFMRLRGQGLPSAGGSRRGSLLVEISVDMPTKLNKKQRSVLAKALESVDEKHYPEVRRFLRIMNNLHKD